MRLINAVVKAPRKAEAPPAGPVTRAAQAPAIALAVYADLLGKPFKDGARGPDAFDCVGLALEMAKRVGKALPAYLSSEDELHAQLGPGAASLADLPQVAKPEPGSIVLLRISPVEHHIAFMVDEFRMIHTMRGIDVSIERVFSNLWQRKVIGYYRITGALTSGTQKG
jgi:cell wall-associated NlpC family hydrolase